MKEAKFRCKRCGKQFIAKIFEPGEAKATRKPSSPVRCPNCGGLVERI